MPITDIIARLLILFLFILILTPSPEPPHKKHH